METKIKPSFNFDDFYSSVKQYLNNGIPNVHLSKGCIGELCVFQEDEGRCSAIINLWQLDFNDFLGLRNEFKRLGASNVFIAETMDYESNFICNGICSEGDTRTITVEFTIEKVCDEVKLARSKAYRDMWKAIYHAARGESFLYKQGDDDKAIYIVKYILKAVNTKVNGREIDLNDVIKMVELAIDLTRPEIGDKPPTRSELRRFEIEQNAKMFADYELDLFKSKDTATPRQIWQLYHRAMRLQRAGVFGSKSLFFCFHNSIDYGHIGRMTDASLRIFYPQLVTNDLSKSAERRILLQIKSNLIKNQNYSAATSFEDELPF